MPPDFVEKTNAIDQYAALERAIDIAGGKVHLARAINEECAARGVESKLSQSHVWQWAKRGKVPDIYVLPIERITEGKVLRFELRPDIYPVEEYGFIREVQNVQSFFRTLCGIPASNEPFSTNPLSQQVPR